MLVTGHRVLISVPCRVQNKQHITVLQSWSMYKNVLSFCYQLSGAMKTYQAWEQSKKE